MLKLITFYLPLGLVLWSVYVRGWQVTVRDLAWGLGKVVGLATGIWRHLITEDAERRGRGEAGVQGFGQQSGKVGGNDQWTRGRYDGGGY